jgi:hypothetical protein
METNCTALHCGSLQKVIFEKSETNTTTSYITLQPVIIEFISLAYYKKQHIFANDIYS